MNVKPQAPKNALHAFGGLRSRTPKFKTTEVTPLRVGDTMFLPDQGPKISGSSLQYTSSSDKSFKIPEARV